MNLKLPHIIDRVRTLIVVLGLAVCASLGMQSQAYAADAKPDPKAQGMADAPALIAAAKITCDVASATARGPTQFPENGGMVKGTLYEVACKTGPGFLITKAADGSVHQPFTCMLADKLHKARPDSILCTLTDNIPPYKWLQPVIKPFLPDCTINDARLVGSSTSGNPIDRYEVGCGTSAGGAVDYPQLGQTGQPDFKSCLLLDATKSPCTLTTKEQSMALMKPLAAKADAKCQVSDVRFVGVTKEGDGTYYEFGCSNQPGFMVLTAMDNTYKRLIPCAGAAGLGGCTFTSAGAAAADANTTYSNLLKAAGKPCTVKEFNVAGTQESTHRDYVEFKCPEQPWGLIGFVPQPGSQSDVNVTDCFIDQVRHKSCSLTTTAQLQAQVDKLIKKAEPTKSCDVKQVRYIGESVSPSNALIVEIACVNKRGYIAVISPDRNSLDADPCRLAAAHGDAQKCTIPENGTYAD